MKLLLYSWNAINEQILADNLIKQGFEVVRYEKPCRHFTRDLELAAGMIPFIHQEKVDAVFSLNYFPIISMICDTCQIPYYAWTYDCPHFTLYAKQIMLSCNHIGIFDRKMAQRLQEMGVRTVQHVPLSVDAETFARTIAAAGAKDRARFGCDISFVGSLYTDEYNYYDRFVGESSQQLDRVIEEAAFSYQRDVIGAAIASGEIDLLPVREKMEEQGLMLGEDYFAAPEDILKADVLEKKVTVEERRRLLLQIAETFGGTYRFHLHTGSNLDELNLLKKHQSGIVDYHRQMPLVFAGSKINLNISLRSIHSGIPLRVLDIMACGGFVLSNWQPEIAECFEEGKEVVTFCSVEECIEKIAYYLKHDVEREAVAAAGFRKVQERFSYREGLAKLLNIDGCNNRKQ